MQGTVTIPLSRYNELVEKEKAADGIYKDATEKVLKEIESDFKCNVISLCFKINSLVPEVNCSYDKDVITVERKSKSWFYK